MAELIRKRGHQTLLIDTGSGEPPTVKPDVSREEVAADGGVDLKGIAERKDRGEAVAAMAGAAAALLSKLVASGRIHGVISLGGGGGTAIGTAAMRALPIGFPKVMVSTPGLAFLSSSTVNPLAAAMLSQVSSMRTICSAIAPWTTGEAEGFAVMPGAGTEGTAAATGREGVAFGTDF